MSLESFTKKMLDSSTQTGFQFTFYCDICQQAYKSNFIQSKGAKKAGFMHGLEEIASIGANLGAYTDPRLAQALRAGADQLTRSQQQFGTMSAGWHQEHDVALASATNDAKSVFSQCPACKKWVCKNDWDSSLGLCTQDAQATKKNSVVQASSSMSATRSTNDASPMLVQQKSSSSTVASLTTNSGAPQTNSPDDPLKLLKMRLAKGEITVDEFEKLKQIMNEE